MAAANEMKKMSGVIKTSSTEEKPLFFIGY